jgi:hypothetical protein
MYNENMSIEQISIWVLALGLSISNVQHFQNSTGSDARWKTYRNTKCNFTVQYPSDKLSTYEGFDGSGVSFIFLGMRINSISVPSWVLAALSGSRVMPTGHA